MSIRTKIALIISFFLWVLILAFTVVSAGVGINHPPTAQFSYLPASPTVGIPVVFNATGSTDPDTLGSIVSYAWDFDGDGTTDVTGSTKISIDYTYTYTAAVTYIVKLTVTDNEGAIGTKSQNITVVSPANQVPVAQFSYLPASPTVGIPVIFSAIGSSDSDGLINSYAWDFDGDNVIDVTGDTIVSPLLYTCTYDTFGTYTVTLTVTDNDGATNTYTDLVTVEEIPINVPPIAQFNAELNTGKSPLTVMFDANQSTDTDGSIVSYDWNFGDEQTASGINVSHTFTAGTTTTYIVTLTVTDNEGASNIIPSQAIIVVSPPNQAPVAQFSYTPASPMVGIPVIFNAAGSSDPDIGGHINSYAWDFGDDGVIASGVSATHTYNTTGTYTVTLTVIDNDGATDTCAQDITVVSPPTNQTPTATVNATPDSGELPLIVTFNANGSDDSDGVINSYAWDFDGDGVTDVTGITKVSPLYTYTYTAAGTYTVTLTVTDNDGATDTCAQDITVVSHPANQAPVAQFSYTPASPTVEAPVGFNATGSSDPDGLINSYTWNFGDGTTGSGIGFTHTYNTSGTYTVTLTVTDDDGVTDTYTDLITVNQTQTTQMPFNAAVRWGPINIFKGNVEELFIKGNTGVGSVCYDIGKSTEGTYIYSLDVSNGKLIGDARISGRCFGIDICERYAFVWYKDGDINVYDLKKKFELAQTILHKNSNEPTTKRISNLGNYLYIQDSKAPDYLIDKRTLEIVNLNISNDDYIYYPLYPDCLIGDSYTFKGSDVDTPAVYSLKEGKILGYLPHDFTHFFAWDPQKKLFFYHNRDKRMVYSMSESKYISELNLSDSAGYSIIANTPTVYGSYGNMHGIVIADVSLSENGYYFLNYFLNGEENAYVLDSSGKIKCQLEKSQIIGEFKGNIMFESNNKESLGSNQNNCNSLWLKEVPNYPGYHKGPHFTEDSISWLCSSGGLAGHGDAIYQWNYETGSYLNYTEFTGYEVDVLSSNPFILAISSDRGKPGKDWYLVCYEPSKLPFNLIPDISVNYSPDTVYSASTDVKFTCTIKNIPVEVQLNNISYEWDFGDGTKGAGKEATHRFEKDGTYNVTVSAKFGDSVDSSTKSLQVAVLNSPGIMLTATPKFYTAEGLSYDLQCKINNPINVDQVIWDFGDGEKFESGAALFKSHVYKPGNYVAKVTIYNSDKTASWQEEVEITSKFPEFSASASPLEGYTALEVNFNCSLVSTDLPDSGLTYQWKIGSEVISEKISFDNVFVDPGTSVVTLEVRDPAFKPVTNKTFKINVYRPYLSFSDGGRKIESISSMFVDTKYDIDKDGINQAWEDEAMNSVNPYFELDEGEDWFRFSDTDKVVNFVRITPYINKFNEKFILFFYCIVWSRDYGRYSVSVGTNHYYKGFEAHTGDVEKVIMAWKVIDDKHLELKYVYTSAHNGELTDHSAVWAATGESCNKGKTVLWPSEKTIEDPMCATLEFNNNILKLQVSEDKHAIYPTAACGDSVSLVLGVFGEDCGGSEPCHFKCYNASEPDAHHLIDDISNIFPNERIWSGNTQKPNRFCGGLECGDKGPGTIGGCLSKIDGILEGKLETKQAQENP